MASTLGPCQARYPGDPIGQAAVAGVKKGASSDAQPEMLWFAVVLWNMSHLMHPHASTK